MTLTTAGATATKSLATLSNQISIVSRNISGAGVAGVSRKIALLASGENGVDFLGVSRATNIALFRSLLTASASQGAATTHSDALERIDQALNLSDPANSRSPASLITRLTSALQSYSASPGNETAAQVALAAAKDVTASLRDATAITQKERSDADAGIAAAVNEVNDILTKFAELNRDIVAGNAIGADMTDALDQRDDLLAQLSTKIGVTTTTRPNNDMVIYTDSGVTLFETTPRTISFQPTPNLAPGVAGAAIYIDGVQVTGSDTPLALRTGELYGLTQIRDVTAPQYQNQLDEIARGLVVAFAETDQSGAGGPALAGLFTYPGATTAPDATMITGLAARITINANVDPAQGGALSRLRDGGISGNPPYVYNSSGADGYSARILQLVNAAAAPQSFDNAAGLGADGSVNSIAAGSNGWIGAQRRQADSDTTYFDAMVAQSTQALSNSTGVNLDDQMSQMLELENSYQASAKLLETVNSLFNTLFAAIRI